MFCSNCGKKQPENGGAFCSKCGHTQAENISQSISPPQTQPHKKQHVQPPRQQHYQQASPPVQNNTAATGGKTPNKNWIIYLIVAAILVGGFMMFTGGSGHPLVGTWERQTTNFTERMILNRDGTIQLLKCCHDNFELEMTLEWSTEGEFFTIGIGDFTDTTRFQLQDGVLRIRSDSRWEEWHRVR